MEEKPLGPGLYFPYCEWLLNEHATKNQDLFLMGLVLIMQ